MCQGKAALTRIGQRTLEEVLFGQSKKVTFDSKEGKQLHLGPGAQSDLLSQGMPGDPPVLRSLHEGVKQGGPEGRGERAPQKRMVTRLSFQSPTVDPLERLLSPLLSALRNQQK